MIIEPGTTSTAPTRSAVAASKLSDDYQSFLTLLTAQISNQDPLEPMDSTAFVSQLAQLTQVEQSVTMNANLEAISAQLANVGAFADLQLIGRTVTVPSETVSLTQGAANLQYMVGPGARDVSVEIHAADGTLVRRLTDLATFPGVLLGAYWDGRDEAGQLAADDTYFLSISAKDDAGNAVSATTYDKAQVRRLSMAQGGSTLELSSGVNTASSNIVAVE